jgi:hypothetical protein
VIIATTVVTMGSYLAETEGARLDALTTAFAGRASVRARAAFTLARDDERHSFEPADPLALCTTSAALHASPPGHAEPKRGRSLL